MTVSTDLNRKQYTGDGVTVSFATSPVVFFDSSDLDVYVVTTATGAATLLTENTDYTVTGGAGSTGTVSLAGGSSPYGAPSASQTLVIVRNVPLTQESDFVQNDASDAEVVEDALDKLTMADQQLSARLDRSFTLADSDVSGASLTVPTPVAGTLVGWNDAGTALQNYEVGDLNLFTVSVPWAAVIDDASIAEGFETIAGALTADTAPAVDDYVFIRSTLNTQGRKTTWQNAFKVINGFSADATPDGAADYVVTYDASTSTAKKVLLDNLPLGQVATKSDQETATSVALAVTPGRQQCHPSAAKAWVKFDSDGGISASYNVSSVTDNGTGDWTVNFTTPFATADYFMAGMSQYGGGSEGLFMMQRTDLATPTAGACRVSSMYINTNATAADSNRMHVGFFGDQ